MVTHPANQKLHKTEFNSQEDWDTYPTADYCCDKCSQIVSFNSLTWQSISFLHFLILMTKTKKHLASLHQQTSWSRQTHSLIFIATLAKDQLEFTTTIGQAGDIVNTVSL
jgi:hypothetical protein